MFLLKRKMGENTVRKHSQIAAQFFTAAVQNHLIDTNPFAHLKKTVQSNPERFFFVTAESAEKVINACPDAQWRLLFALSRYGRPRCPSEHLALRCEDVNWELDRIHVTSPKTEHHTGGKSRLIPLFPELRPYLEDCQELAERGDEYVITRYRDANSNLRTQLKRIIKRAGLKPWPRLFHNLRSSRQTELEERFPSHVVCSWIRNSPQVARRHYLQVTDEHFARAAKEAVPAKSKSALQNALQRAAAGDGNASQAVTLNPANLRKSRGGRDLRNEKVAEAGLEPATHGL